MDRSQDWMHALEQSCRQLQLPEVRKVAHACSAIRPLNSCGYAAFSPAFPPVPDARMQAKITALKSALLLRTRPQPSPFMKAVTAVVRATLRRHRTRASQLTHSDRCAQLASQ